MIIYMTVLISTSGHKEVKFSGSKHQFYGLKKRLASWSGLAAVELQELHVSASDFTTLEVAEAR